MRNLMLKKVKIGLLGVAVVVGIMALSEKAFGQSPGSSKAAAKPSDLSVADKKVATTNPAPKTAQEAIQTAQKAGKYLLLLFYEKNDDAFKAMDTAVKTFLSKNASKTNSFNILTTNKENTDLVTKYRINRAPLPILLVMAPNGAITGGFPRKVESRQIEVSIVPEIIAKVLKPLQDNKVVLVLLQNSKTKSNSESLSSAEEFSKDERLKGSVEIIKEDPAVAKNEKFLTQCKLDKNISESTLVLLTPPGSILGVYPGRVSKETLFNKIVASSSGCGPGGCGSGGGGCK